MTLAHVSVAVVFDGVAMAFGVSEARAISSSERAVCLSRVLPEPEEDLPRSIVAVSMFPNATLGLSGLPKPE